MGDKGVSVQEIEVFAKKYIIELFLIVALIIAMISSVLDFFTGASWSIGFAGLGAIFGIAYPNKILAMQKKTLQFLRKQELAVQIMIGIVRIILALFVPFIIFLEVGLLAGLGFHILPKLSKELSSNFFQKEIKSSPGEEEHL